MKCPHCQTLNPQGAPRCSLCGADLPPAAEAPRRASGYFGVHTVVGEDGRAVRAFLDLGPRPWPNLLVGLGILLLFALSTLPAIIGQSGRSPASIGYVIPAWRPEGLEVGLLVIDGDRRPIATDATAQVGVWLREPGDSLSGGTPLGGVTVPLRRQDFPVRRIVSRDPRTGRRREVVGPLGRVGPLGPENLGGVGREGAVGRELGVSVRLVLPSGRALEGNSGWALVEPD